MTLDEYLAIHPEMEGQSEYARSLTHGSVRSALLEYTEETAGWLAPPYADKYGLLIIQDCRKWSFRYWSLRSVHDLIAEMRKKAVAARRRQEFMQIKPGKGRGILDMTDAEIESLLREDPTKEYPFRLRIMGLDDSSWSLCYPSLEEASETFDLLMACAPVDHFKDVLPLGVFFTN